MRYDNGLRQRANDNEAEQGLRLVRTPVYPSGEPLGKRCANFARVGRADRCYPIDRPAGRNPIAQWHKLCTFECDASVSSSWQVALRTSASDEPRVHSQDRAESEGALYEGRG